MGIKKHIKKIGRYFFDLRQENKGIGAQSVLVVDNGYSWIGQVCAGIGQLRGHFPRAVLSVLTFPERKDSLQKDFPKFDFILPSQRLKPKKYQIALQMFLMRRKYDFIALYSLDITPMVVSLLFYRGKVALYNQWGQWWTLRLRNISEIFKVTYVKKKINLLKKIGLFFVLLQREDDKVLRPSIAILRTNHTLSEHIDSAIQGIRESFPEAEISVLSLDKIIGNILRFRKMRYDYIVILSLDIFPVILSLIFVKGKIYLFNKWHQWWSIRPKSFRSYLAIIPQSIFNIITFIYLLFSVFWIFLKMLVNLFGAILLGKRVYYGNRCETI